uniref:Protein yippee-like n=1 Tax=Panagrolaimus sp. JU765 TaxID=591449 RepID=A0AC34QHD6_9BILA
MGRLFVENFGGNTIFECRRCNVFLTNQKELISRTFRGATGPAFLFSRVANIKHGSIQQRCMMTGKHYVRDVHCKFCDAKLGWIYEFACDKEQQYKEGKVILERSFIHEVAFESTLISSPPMSLSPGSVSNVSSITIT